MNKETLNKLKDLADYFIPEARYIVLMAHKELSERTTSPVSQMTDTRVDDLAMLVRRLVRALEHAHPGMDLSAQALDYLKRNGLDAIPQRKESA